MTAFGLSLLNYSQLTRGRIIYSVNHLFPNPQKAMIEDYEERTHWKKTIYIIEITQMFFLRLIWKGDEIK